MHSWDETTKETENPLKVSNDPDKRYLSLSLESSFNQPQGHMWPCESKVIFINGS